jgi:Wax ester synthase-like Acyl-CoA acyltransferase domain
MRQLTSLDSQFLALETRRQTGHVASVAILNPSTTPSGTLTVADIEALITERLPLLPPLRWRLLEVPLNLDYPYWIDDEDFDLHFHVRELGLAAPGTDEQLAEQVARIVSRPLDRGRPLWELYLISGLDSGHLALLTKIHHAVIDGLSGAEILGLLLDLTPQMGQVPPSGTWGDNEAVPGDLGMLVRGITGAARYPLPAAGAQRAAPGAAEPRGDAVQGDPRRCGDRPPRQPPSAGDHAPGRARRAHLARRAEDDVQRAHLRPPALHLRPALARRRQDGQERVRLHGQRRHRLDLRWRGAALAARARRAPGRPARRADPRLRAHRGADRHLRQPHHAHGRAAAHGDRRSRGAPAPHPRVAGRHEAAPPRAAREPACGCQPLHPARRLLARRG